jgi:hypothetical protein
MKKYLLTFALGGLLLTTGLTSCLKDKGYDNGQYGVNGPSAKAVSIPQSTSSPIAMAINAITTVQTIDAPTVNLESPTVAAEDVTVTLVVDQSLVPNGLVPLATTQFNVTSLVITIPAGQRTATAQLNIPNAAALNANNKYGVGFKIASVSPAGYAIASNMKSVVIQISVKNKYDGVYNLSGVHNRPTLDAPYHDIEVHMITTGPNSITMLWPDNSTQPYSHPINGGNTYYSDFTTNFYFDLATNAFIGWDMLPYPLGVTPGVGPATDSRYDPNTKIIYAQYFYNNNPGARRFSDTLVYTGPRP